MNKKHYQSGYKASVFGASKDSCNIPIEDLENRHYWLAGWHDYKMGYELNLNNIN